MTDDEFDGEALRRLALEISARPEGPAALGLMAEFDRRLRPHREAVSRLVEALADDLSVPDAATALRVIEAKRSFVETTGMELDAGVLDDLVADAGRLLVERRKRPPAMEEILDAGAELGRDVAYELGLLSGLRGTWHRLWACLGLEYHLGPEGSVVADVRAEFEALLGRPLNDGEWDRLRSHAKRHADEVMAPALGRPGSLS